MPPRQDKARKEAPRCIVIAGPHGAGKTTFAQEFLPHYAGIIHFVNVDSIASGLAPFRPRMAAIRARRLLLSEIDRLAATGAGFAIESTLSGLGHLSRLENWKQHGYRVEAIYLTLPSPEVALRRIELRVRQGGHGIPKADVVRRFQRSWSNFQKLYKPMADAWMVYDNSRSKPRSIEAGP